MLISVSDISFCPTMDNDFKKFLINFYLSLT